MAFGSILVACWEIYESIWEHVLHTFEQMCDTVGVYLRKFFSVCFSRYVANVHTILPHTPGFPISFSSSNAHTCCMHLAIISQVFYTGL